MGRSGPAVLVSDEAVANCHKHSGGNHANALSSSARGQKSKQSLWAKIEVLAGFSFLWTLSGRICFLVRSSFQTRLDLHSLACVPFLHLQSQQP